MSLLSPSDRVGPSARRLLILVSGVRGNEFRCARTEVEIVQRWSILVAQPRLGNSALLFCDGPTYQTGSRPLDRPRFPSAARSLAFGRKGYLRPALERLGRCVRRLRGRCLAVPDQSPEQVS
jgi:hypothetical protein